MHLYILYYTYIRITSYNVIIGRNSNAHTHTHTHARAHARTYARKRKFQIVEVLCKVKTCFSTDRRFLQKKLF